MEGEEEKEGEKSREVKKDIWTGEPIEKKKKHSEKCKKIKFP